MHEEIKNLIKIHIDVSPDDYSVQDILPIYYRKNSHGYRCDDFNNSNNDKKILTLGCSHTWGQGVFEENIWTNILSQKLNLNLVNLAIGGDSVMGQVRKAFYYFREFGNPKIVVAVFPLFRMEFPYVRNRTSDENFTEDKVPSRYMIERITIYKDDFRKFSKYPHDPKEVISYEATLFFNYVFIDMLDQYCKSHNIPFIWTFWESEDAVLEEEMNRLKDRYSHVDIEPLKWFIYNGVEHFNGSPVPTDCHKEISDSIIFQEGADRNIGTPHWGIHRHAHIAEAMYDECIKIL